MAIYALEMFGILYGVLSTVLAVFVPKLIYVLEDPDNTQKVVTGATTAGGSRNGSKNGKSHPGELGMFFIVVFCTTAVLYRF